ncbi:MAG: hypothetical protein GY847_11365 [Proteobacteria bacterium]|nr:hypothetical protein [Pseudomonadota bacterium]
MNKSDLIEALANQTNIKKSRAENLVNWVFGAMTDANSR